jgi:O-antigen/teichoic acid export membrane protein
LSLKRKVIKGGVLLQISKGIQFLSNLVVSLILARILNPEIFGLAGIATLVSSLVSQFTILGVNVGNSSEKKGFSKTTFFNILV